MQISDDLVQVMSLQEGHGGWIPEMQCVRSDAMWPSLGGCIARSSYNSHTSSQIFCTVMCCLFVVQLSVCLLCTDFSLKNATS